MSFLAPWFVIAGLATVVLPVVFHLLRRTPRGRLPFSSLMFLTPSPPRLTSRSRLDHLPLLLLRGLILTLLALAFGRPFWREWLEQSLETPVGERIVVLVDTSASMRRGDLFAEAIRTTEQIVQRCGSYDELAIASFALDTQPHLTFETWREAPSNERVSLAHAALAEIRPTWAATRLDQALLAAVEMLESADQAKQSAVVERRCRVVLVSDLQTGARLSGLQGFEWPRRIAVELATIETKSTNAGVHALTVNDYTAKADVPDQQPRVLVMNAALSERETFALQWHSELPADANGSNQKPLSIYVPPGQSRVVRTPPLPAGDVAQLVLSGDDEPFDNVLWFVPPTREHVRVLHLATDQADDPQSLRFFLERALGQGWAGRHITVDTVDPHAAATRPLTVADLENVPLVVVALARELPREWLTTLRTWLDRGGVALAVVAQAEVAPWRELLPETLADPVHITISAGDRSREYALLSDLDLRHPWLAPLNDPRFSDFTKIRFWQHRQIGLDDWAVRQSRVVARFDTGKVAWLDVPRGAGRVVLMASGWQPRESQLGVSSKFVPLLATLVELGWRKAPPAVNYDAGEIVDLSRLGDPESNAVVAEPEPAKDPAAATPTTSQPVRANGPWTITSPSGRTTTVAADAPRWLPDEGPGVYAVRSASGLQRLAIQLAADESKTARLGNEVLETLGVRLISTKEAIPELSATEKQTLQSRQLEARQQWWRWCLLMALGVVIGETWYAGRVARQEGMS